jgi:hypothetical protein
MRVRLIFISIILPLVFISACNKESAKPKTPATLNPTPTITQSLAGKWYFVKDTVVATDLYTPITFPQAYRLSHLDYIVFNPDGITELSEQVANDALVTPYTRLYVNPNEFLATAPFVYQYKGSATDSTLVLTKADGSTRGYAIKKLTADSLVLYTQTEITKYPHDYRFVQYIRFSSR